MRYSAKRNAGVLNNGKRLVFAFFLFCFTGTSAGAQETTAVNQPGDNLPIQRRLIKKVGFYGDALDFSKFSKRPDSNFLIKIVSRYKDGWGSAGVDFNMPLDISACDRI